MNPIPRPLHSCTVSSLHLLRLEGEDALGVAVDHRLAPFSLRPVQATDGGELIDATRTA